MDRTSKSVSALSPTSANLNSLPFQDFLAWTQCFFLHASKLPQTGRKLQKAEIPQWSLTSINRERSRSRRCICSYEACLQLALAVCLFLTLHVLAQLLSSQINGALVNQCEKGNSFQFNLETTSTKSIAKQYLQGGAAALKGY